MVLLLGAVESMKRFRDFESTLLEQVVVARWSVSQHNRRRYLVALNDHPELGLHRRVHGTANAVAASLFKPRFDGGHQRIMDLAGVTAIGDFVEPEKAKFVIAVFVVQIVLDRHNSPDWLILVVVANENFARCGFVERMSIDVEKLSLHNLERVDNGRIIPIDFPPQTVEVFPVFA